MGIKISMEECEELADTIRFGDPSDEDNEENNEWWKDDGREDVAKSLYTLIEVHGIPKDVAESLVYTIFHAGTQEYGG